MKKYNLYSDVLSIKGYCRSLLFDTTRSQYYFISNDVYDSLTNNGSKNFEISSIDEGFQNLLIEKDLIYESDERVDNCFTPINLEWDFSFKITNFVIELSDQNIDHLLKLSNFDYVAHFHVLFNNKIEINTIDKLFDFLNVQICDSVEFSFISKLDLEILGQIKYRMSSLEKLVKILDYAELDFEEDLGKAYRFGVSLEHANLQLTKFADHYFESLKYHTYFNRKLFLSKNGEFKNAFECEQNFKNIENCNNSQDIFEMIDSKEFQKYWFIQKTHTDVCKDCELRHNCVDNRLPLKRNTKEWYHEKECKYNPYIAKWIDEEGYISLSECGIISNEFGFSIDHEKVDNINAVLWADEEIHD